MNFSFCSLISLFVMLSGTPLEDRFDLIVQVRSAPGTKLPSEVWVTVDGLDTGHYSTNLLSKKRTVKFPALAPGRYRVTVDAEGHQPSQVAFEARTSRGDEYVTVDLGPPIPHDKDHAETAVVHYQALQLSPQSNTHWEEAGKALAEKRLDSALKSLEQVARMNPKFAPAHSSLGIVFLKLRDWNQAEQAFLKAVELDPGNYRYHVGLGWFYLQTDRATEAITPLQRTVELKPDDAEGQAFLGEALRLSGRTEQSVVHLEKAVVLNPTLGLALHSLALVYLDLDRPNKALESFRSLLETEAVPPERMKEIRMHISELEKRAKGR